MCIDVKKRLKHLQIALFYEGLWRVLAGRWTDGKHGSGHSEKLIKARMRGVEGQPEKRRATRP